MTMNIFMFKTLERGKTVKLGDVAKQQVSKLYYNRAMETLFEQSNKDYFKLTHPVQNVKAANNIPDGFKNFFKI